MAAPISKADYLKRYLSDAEKPKKKKRRKIDKGVKKGYVYKCIRLFQCRRPPSPGWYGHDAKPEP